MNKENNFILHEIKKKMLAYYWFMILNIVKIYPSCFELCKQITGLIFFWYLVWASKASSKIWNKIHLILSLINWIWKDNEKLKQVLNLRVVSQ